MNPRSMRCASIAAALLITGALMVWQPQSVPATGEIAAAYAFSQGTSTLADDFSGFGNMATLAGGVAWSPAGRYGGALVFDGLDDAVVAADSGSLDLTNTFTLVAWVHPTGDTPSGTVLRKAGTSGDPYSLGITASGFPFVSVTTFAGTTTFVGDELVVPNRWTHVATVYTGSSIRLFVNGSKEWSWPFSGPLVTSAGALSIGGSPGGGFFEGRLDEVRVYAVPLHPALVLGDMATPVDPATPLTVGTHTPAGGAPGVLTTPITARFTRPVDALTLTGESFQMRRGATWLAATIGYDPSTRTVILTPAAALEPLTDYTITVLSGANGVKDPTGAGMGETVVWSFQTGSDASTVRLAYGFGGGTGTTVDDASGNGNAAALMNGPVWTIQGRYGRGLVFDGVNDALRVPDADTQDVTTALTLEAWVYPTAVTTTAKIIHKQNYPAQDPYWLGLASGAAYARVRTAAGRFDVAGSTALPLGQWSHLAVTYDNAALRLFVNGLETASRPVSGEVLVSHKPLWIGSAFNAEWFAGRIDDVRLYARALSPAEIVEDMNTSVEDITGPAVIGTNPLAEAVDIDTNTNVTAAFDEPLAAASVSTSTFELRNATGNLVPASVAYDASTRTVTLDPSGPLESSRVYTATLQGGTTGPRITDTTGNPLAAGYSWSFTTGDAPGAPDVISLSIFPRGMSLSVGGAHQFTATAHYSNGTTMDVSTIATWQSSGAAVTLSAAGRATAVAAGQAVVSATHQGFSGEASIAVYEDEAIPPDPKHVAPSIPPHATAFVDSIRFLYSGENPIQRDVVPGVIQAERAAVVRGTLWTLNAQHALAAQSGARVTVEGHPEFGYTLTRLDGGYDLVVNGGGAMTIRFEKANYLPAQRSVDVSWGDFAIAPDAALVALDPLVTAVVMGSPNVQVAQGSQTSDEDGVRRATVVFNPGTTASMVMPDGTTRQVAAMNVRATEYTVGPNGETAMPAPLPATSAYTYAVELSADEAIQAGARSVDFNQPVAVYVENFLGFPVGDFVPSGYYDRALASWVASDDGRVVQILGTDESARAELDVDGDGQLEDRTVLDALGVTDAERRTIATTYAAGQTLWRVPVTHFTPWDFNKGQLSLNAQLQFVGSVRPVNRRVDPKQCVTKCGSILEMQRQVLGETLPLAGTPFRLNYRSDRAPGRVASRALYIPLSHADPPDGLKRIDLAVAVAGRRTTQTFPPTSGQATSFTWDGQDAYDRPVQRNHSATVTLGYAFDVAYGEIVGNTSRRFGRRPTVTSGVPARHEVVGYRTQAALLGPGPRASAPIGGWSVDPHHHFDPVSRTLYQGDGTQRPATSISRVVERVAGGGSEAVGATPILARDAAFNLPRSMVATAGGTLYVADIEGISRITSNGTIARVVSMPPDQDSDVGLAVGSNGSVYYTTTNVAGGMGGGGCFVGASYDRVEIRRIPAAGPPILVAIATLPTSVFCSGNAARLAVDRNGTFYVAAVKYLLRIVPGGSSQVLLDRFDDIDAHFTAVAAAPDGAVYVATPGSIDRVTPDGRASRYAGIGWTGLPGHSGDGGPATAAELGRVTAIVGHADASVTFADEGQGDESGGFASVYRLRRVTPDGIITTIAGGAAAVDAIVPDGTPAFGAPVAMVGLADGGGDELYATGGFPGVAYRIISRLSLGVAFVIPSEDGSQLHEFDATGRHLRTRHALTGAILYEYSYDGAGRLVAIFDGDGLETTVEWSGDAPTAIEGPFGQRTALEVDAHGYLRRVTAPGGRTTHLTSSPDGLLTQLVDASGRAYVFRYDAVGLLARDEDPAGGVQTLARSELPEGWEVTHATGLERASTYRTEDSAGSQRLLTNTTPDGTQTTQRAGPNATLETVTADGMRTQVSFGADPRFGLLAAFPRSVMVRAPSGLTLTSETTRTTTLTDPANLLSLQAQTDTTLVNGRAYRTVFDAVTRTFTMTTPAGRASTARIDAQGRITSTQLGTLTPIDFGYDARGRLRTIAQGARHARIDYDTAGRPETLRDALMRTVTLHYDAAERVETQTLPDLRTIQFGYDDNGSVTSLTPPGRPAHRFTYTAVNLAKSYTPPAMVGSGPTAYGFNADRQLTSIERPDAQVTLFTYGTTTGRLESVTFSRGQLQYGYDTAGRVNSLSDPGGVNLAFTYDGALPVSDTWSGEIAGSVSRTFTANFEIQTERVNDAHQVTFGYDADRLLTEAGALTIARHAQNGFVTGTTLGSTTEAFEYDEFGALSRQTARVGSSALFEVQYTRDALGRIRKRTETIDGITRVWDYEFDLADRLANVKRNDVVIASYGYDANGNRLHAETEAGIVDARYDDQDRLLTSGHTTYTYQANGELATKTVAGATTTYQYDTLGNLIRVDLPTGDVITYAIDGQGRRVAKAVNGVRLKGWLYADQLRPVAELDARGEILSRFVYGTRMNVPEYVIRNGVTYRIFSDHLGTPRIVVNASTGQVVQRLDFTAFGEVVQDSNPGWQPFGFAGGLYDPETGIVRFGARDYDSGLGRWLAKEPLGFYRGSSANVYEYAFGDPVNTIDLNGLWSISLSAYTPGGGGGIAFGRTSETGFFLTFEYGIGAGASLSYDPAGRPPGASPGQKRCGPVTVSAGVFAEASLGVGFGNVSVETETGARFSPGDLSPYWRPPSRPSFAFKVPPVENAAGIGASAAAGIRISFQ